ncbi:transporter, partial [Staphylococcus haemolyticus]
MKKLIAAVLAAASCASIAQAQAQAQQAPVPAAPTSAQPMPAFTLDQAVLAAGGSAPANAAAAAGIEAAQAGRSVAGLRPNP